MQAEAPSGDGMLVPQECVPFLEKLLARGGCIIRYKPVKLIAGCCLLPLAAMPIERIEWMDGTWSEANAS